MSGRFRDSGGRRESKPRDWRPRGSVAAIQCFHDGQQLPIISVPILWGCRALTGVDIDRLENPETVVLIETARNSDSTRVHLENDRFGLIKIMEDRCRGEGSFQFPERQFGLPRPFPFDCPTVF